MKVKIYFSLNKVYSPVLHKEGAASLEAAPSQSVNAIGTGQSDFLQRHKQGYTSLRSLL